MGSPTKVANIVASKSYDKEKAKNLNEEIQYLANYLRGSRPANQRKDGNHGWNDRNCDHDWRDKTVSMIIVCPPYDRAKGKDSNSVDPNKFKTEDVLASILIKVEGTEKMFYELKDNILHINQMVVSNSSSIKQLET